MFTAAVAVGCQSESDSSGLQDCGGVDAVASSVIIDLASRFDSSPSRVVAVEFSSEDAAQLVLPVNRLRLRTDRDLAERLTGVKFHFADQYLLIEFESRSDRDRRACDIFGEFEYPSAPVRILSFDVD